MAAVVGRNGEANAIAIRIPGDCRARSIVNLGYGAVVRIVEEVDGVAGGGDDCPGLVAEHPAEQNIDGIAIGYLRGQNAATIDQVRHIGSKKGKDAAQDAIIFNPHGARFCPDKYGGFTALVRSGRSTDRRASLVDDDAGSVKDGQTRPAIASGSGIDQTACLVDNGCVGDVSQVQTILAADD